MRPALRLCEEIKNEMWHEKLDVSELVSKISNIFEDLDLRYPAKKIRILAKEIVRQKKLIKLVLKACAIE
ncbi:hypothetical protein [Leptospira borgpetersenii]|uniref:hypothetical protein n=1 Tax=Leptospira borgpetersenii TaxID=174 RepID=UPI002954B93A|nr:hypothetical protein [Leptospira borgpetersenii]